MSHIPTPTRAKSARTIHRPALVAALTLAALVPMARAADTDAPAAPASTTQSATGAVARKPAGVFVIVRNLAGAALAGREQAFEDLVASRVSADTGLSIISRAEAVTRLSAYDPATTFTDLTGAKVDVALADGTTALRLAQNLDARGILSLSLVSLGKKSNAYTGNGISTTNTTHTLRVSWKVLEAGKGGGIVGNTESVSYTTRESAGLVENNDDLVNDLLDRAAAKVAESARAHMPDASAPSPFDNMAPARVKFTVNVTSRNVFFPEILNDKSGTPRINQDQNPVQLDGVTVELDGAAIGTAPFAAPTDAFPGLHKMRLTREGYKPWEGSVTLREGTVFNASMELTDAALAKWKDQLKVIEDARTEHKLVDFAMSNTTLLIVIGFAALLVGIVGYVAVKAFGRSRNE